MNAPKHAAQILIVFLIILSLSGNVAGGSNITLGITPKSSEAGANETFGININVGPNDNSVYAVQFDLDFDPSILEAETIEKGQFLGQDGTQTVNPIPKPINNSIGKIQYAETRLGVQTGVKNPGTLAIITFRVKEDAKIDSNQSFFLKNVILTDNVPNKLPVDITGGEFKVIKAGLRPQNLTSQKMPEKGEVISQELLVEMGKKTDSEKISIKISVDQKDSAQNLVNLVTFLDSKGTEVSDINQVADALTCSASKKLINEISGLPYVTGITTYEAMEAAKKQPGFGIIITTAIVLLMYLKLKIFNINSRIKKK